MNNYMIQGRTIQKYSRMLLILLLMILTGCGSDVETAPILTPVVPVNRPGEYYVQPGDTLFSIAFAFGLDYRTLMQINGIRPGEQIQPGQYLVVNPQYARPVQTSQTNYTQPGNATGQVNQVNQVKTIRTPQSVKIQSIKLPPVAQWVWPAQGKVIQTFNPAQGNKGINIAGQMGSPIRAAAAGIVVYAGSGLPAYGNMIIIKNSDEYLSAYAHNQQLLVKEGDKVEQNQVIAKMGNTGTTETMLHFEIRENGQPVNPLLYLK